MPFQVSNYFKRSQVAWKKKTPIIATLYLTNVSKAVRLKRAKKCVSGKLNASSRFSNSNLNKVLFFLTLTFWYKKVIAGL